MARQKTERLGQCYGPGLKMEEGNKIARRLKNYTDQALPLDVL
jgi:hypothetical protein